MRFQKAMLWWRFEEIIQYLHFADNSYLNKKDKMTKLCPLFNDLNERFLMHFPNEQHLSIDESMVPYFGHHGCKQFIKGKPVRFGYKFGSLNTKLGYSIQFERSDMRELFWMDMESLFVVELF
ncbi:chimeric ERCC6-PGBD3 protein [Nephila pilipes]|uniref:Chimeric ERCC6-PGBD3 protein n=1 Tax=Nephila pilipes TaxID=299642 RepID=A0A8X6QP84_NEPPI|nr:chimeric ERCC6-PGBD3 protein [Nephila pilipes]